MPGKRTPHSSSGAVPSRSRLRRSRVSDEVEGRFGQQRARNCPVLTHPRRLWKHPDVVDAGQPLGNRAVLAIDLKDDPAIIETYRKHHRDVWPEVIASLQASGIRSMDIYILGRRLVMLLETDGRHYQECFSSHVASHPRVAEWEALMRSMQESPADSRQESWWTPMEPLFHLGGPSGGHLT